LSGLLSKEERLTCERVQDGLLQTLEHRLHIGLQLVSILVVNGFFLVVDPSILKDLVYIVLEVFTKLISPFIELFLNLLKIHGLTNYRVVITDLLGIHWLLEWPSIHMLIQGLENILALLLKSLLFTLFGELIALLCPTSFSQPRDLIETILLVFSELKARVDSHVTHLEYLLNKDVSLSLQCI